MFESLLRVFLQDHREKVTFEGLIETYRRFLSEHDYPQPTFVKELTEFNRRRSLTLCSADYRAPAGLGGLEGA